MQRDGYPELKGYIYITGTGFDPGSKQNLTDPSLFGSVPTLGACMPNIRRFVGPGDYVFVISGSTPGLPQYLIGGMKVARKVDARAAYAELPSHRLARGEDGVVRGNIIAGANGEQDLLDVHPPAEFEKRTSNYVIGDGAVLLETSREVALGRAKTIPFLAKLFKQKGERPIDIIGRMKKLDAAGVKAILEWLSEIKNAAK